jgi:ketosteroid isomerase-like protein
MSQENVEIVRAAFEAWNRNDFDAWIQCFDPEVQWSALLEEFRGHAGIRRAWQSFKVDLQLRARYDDIRDLGDSVLALGELTGKGRITGLNISAEIAQLATFRDGRILSFRDFARHAEALEAVGLSERDAPADS